MQTLKEQQIFIGTNLIEKVASLVSLIKYTSTLIVVDKNIPVNFVQKLQSALPIKANILQIKSGEQYKNLASVRKIWTALKKFHCDRKSLVINVGGGVIGDTGGFAASTFMRGIDFLQIPTTLLAQVDASIGGKVGINFAGIKNLIGTFQQPVAVIIDVNVLTSLPKREFISGFAEIIKHGVIIDKEYFQLVTAKKPQDFSQKELIEIIKKSCQIKNNIVSSDKKEGGLRKLLNFGHTIGHAIESLSQETKTPLLHGEAVSIGMVAESKISNLLGLLSDADYKQIRQVLVQAGLPAEVPNLKTEDILEKIKSDKKNVQGETKFILLKSICKTITDQTVDQSIIKKAL